jgi:hypothetical protein
VDGVRCRLLKRGWVIPYCFCSVSFNPCFLAHCLSLSGARGAARRAFFRARAAQQAFSSLEAITHSATTIGSNFAQSHPSSPLECAALSQFGGHSELSALIRAVVLLRERATGSDRIYKGYSTTEQSVSWL